MRIGYRRQWEQLVREKQYRVVGHQLVPIGNDEASLPGAGEVGAPLHAEWETARHLTVQVRYGFSAPIRSLGRNCFLDGSHTLFDYGCGRGDDLRGLAENGISAAEWDPYYAPEKPVAAADIVNLGFLVTVIEDFEEPHRGPATRLRDRKAVVQGDGQGRLGDKTLWTRLAERTDSVHARREMTASRTWRWELQVNFRGKLSGCSILPNSRSTSRSGQ